MKDIKNDEAKESFTEYKDSFSYGSRSDLNFKFLKSFSPEDAAQFFQDLLLEVGELVDGGMKGKLIDFVYQSQVKGYVGAGRYVYEDAPFKRLKQPLLKTRLALMSSSGHFVDGDDPKPLGVEAMTQAEAEARISDFIKEEPQLSEIPIETPGEDLRVRHGGYDTSGAQKDANVNFPIQRMRELRDEGVLPELHRTGFSFVGACSQMRLQKETAPRWAKYFKESYIDALLLVPVWPVCHVSVGHIARLMEEEGIATVVIGSGMYEERLRAMNLPRTIITQYPLGRPLGMPGNIRVQRKILMNALNMLESAESPGEVLVIRTDHSE